MGKPAARVGDMTAHGGMITGPGVPNVLIGGMPAATMGDMHVCPMVTPGVPPIPHVGGPLVGPVPPTVLIGGKPAACVGDMAICVGPPSSILPPGCPTVLFGQSGGGGGGGGGGSGKDAKSASGDSAESIEPVEGTETFPVEIQRIIANAAKNMTKDQTKAVIDQVAKSLAESGYTGEPQQDTYTELTLSDIAEVLKSVEKNESYEAARHFASHLDYGKLTEIAKAYVNGEDTNPDNDPNLMPTRFMLLYGMEDSKIKDINDHPDCDPQNPHQINLKNLRKALRMQGAQIAEEGTFDDEVYYAWHNYVIKIMRNLKAGFTHTVAEYEGLGDIARSYNLPSWKYLYQCNKDLIGNNPDLLKNGMELKIPQWDDTTGDEMITEKGADLSKYVGGLGWRYPWQSLSVSFIEDIKRGLLPDFDDERRFKLVTEETGETILNGTIKRCDELDVIIPDLVQVKSFVEGLTIK